MNLPNLPNLEPNTVLVASDLDQLARTFFDAGKITEAEHDLLRHAAKILMRVRFAQSERDAEAALELAKKIFQESGTKS